MIFLSSFYFLKAIAEWRDQLTYLKQESQRINAWKNILSLVEESIESRKRRSVTEQYSKQSQQLKSAKKSAPAPTTQSSKDVKSSDVKLPKSSKLELAPNTSSSPSSSTTTSTSKTERTPEQEQLFQKLVKDVDEKFMEENNEVFETKREMNLKLIFLLVDSYFQVENLLNEILKDKIGQLSFFVDKLLAFYQRRRTFFAQNAKRSESERQSLFKISEWAIKNQPTSSIALETFLIIHDEDNSKGLLY